MLSNIISRSTAAFGGAPFRLRKCTALSSAGAGAGAGARRIVTGTLYADLSTATAATINAIRTAFQVQKLLERDARGGTRYTEIIRSHFGVVSPDSRLQRPNIVTGKQIGRAHV